MKAQLVRPAAVILLLTLAACGGGGGGGDGSTGGTVPAVSSVPGAPTGIVATAGDAGANFAFTPPASNGGSAITGYQVTWVGLGNSSTKLGPLPVPPTDSIFAVVVEELGLLGAIGLGGLYGILLWRAIKIAKKAPDSLGSVLAAGCTFWIAM